MLQKYIGVRHHVLKHQRQHSLRQRDMHLWTLSLHFVKEALHQELIEDRSVIKSLVAGRNGGSTHFIRGMRQSAVQ